MPVDRGHYANGVGIDRKGEPGGYTFQVRRLRALFRFYGVQHVGGTWLLGGDPGMLNVFKLLDYISANSPN